MREGRACRFSWPLLFGVALVSHKALMGVRLQLSQFAGGKKGTGTKMYLTPLIDAADEVGLVQHVGGDLLDRLGGRVEEGDLRLAHDFLRGGDLIAAVVDGGVARIGTALVADLVQAFCRDGQAPDLALERYQGRRQAVGLEVF